MSLTGLQKGLLRQAILSDLLVRRKQTEIYQAHKTRDTASGNYLEKKLREIDALEEVLDALETGE